MTVPRSQWASGASPHVWLLLVLTLSGCGLPTWSELIGGKKEEVPQQNPNPPQPVVTHSPTPPPQPKPPSDEELIAAFQARKTFELDDTALLDLSKVSEEGRGKINEINLNGSRVTNGGLQHLTKLPNLRSLDVRNSPVDKDGAQAIAALTSLESLKFDGGEMTDEAIQALNPLTQLKYLELNNVRLSPGGWAQLANHPQLESLYISSCNLNDATMELIGEITSLKTLYIDSVPITDQGLRHLKGLDNLQQMHLGGTGVTGIAFVEIFKAKGLKSLEELNMGRTPLNERGAMAIKNMTQLQRLVLDGLVTMRDQHFVPMVKPLKNLQAIKIVGCKGLTGQAFTAFVGNEKIEVINASGCDGINDSGLVHLVKCKSLKKLDLSDTQCTLRGVKLLMAQLPELEVTGMGPLGTPGPSTAHNQ
ncbi:MAG TPA: hypothetical protein VFG20_02145 [Planctomycetaceae bacterium]|nr:hypothetical protein [Planctomycetaceae bacterium]